MATAAVRQDVPYRLTRLGAVMRVEGHRFVFYGMADSSIGVARLDRDP
jgi:hypothetical protein